MRLQHLCETERWEEARVLTAQMAAGVTTRGAVVVGVRLRSLLELGLPEEAVEAWREAGRPDDWKALASLGLARSGREEEARRLTAECSGPQRPEAMVALGQICAEAGDAEEALRWVEGVRFSPSKRRALREAAVLLEAVGDYEEARLSWEQCLRLSPYLNVDDVERLTACLRLLGKQGEACELERLLATRS